MPPLSVLAPRADRRRLGADRPDAVLVDGHVERFGIVRFGRPRKLNTDQAQVAAQLRAEGKPVRDIARTFNVHEATIYRLAAASYLGFR